MNEPICESEMSEPIDEFGMSFGPYPKADLFRIEKSNVYKSLGESIKAVEFILHKNDSEIIFVEAKSSFSSPGNTEDFDKNVNDVCDKFIHSMDIYFALILKQLQDKENEMPARFTASDCSRARLKLCLVINGHDMKWLPPINNSLRMKLKRQIKVWNVAIIVMNNINAADYELIDKQVKD